MPELPEVESTRRILLPHLLGQRVTRVEVRRRDVIAGPKRPRDLLEGREIADLRRRGKQLALVGPGGRPGVIVQLGMTGSLTLAGPADRLARDPHVHVVWELGTGETFRFRDVRRFGGLRTFPDLRTLERERWSRLGEDALSISPARLHEKLGRTKRALKAALLDQQLVAGLGNIYVDELLFACRLSPLMPAFEVTRPQAGQLTRQMKRILRAAIDSGGSTVRDFVGGGGAPGAFQLTHQVYGRAGLPCRLCGAELTATRIIGRTSVFCPDCQPLPRGKPAGNPQ
ncbi:MAG: bifunctional DNA-formamidopyrimidine glycosylase/DNA-(apurinic or apyrimidinic site) lyase [Phycisphaeraceae bacterium]